MQPSSQTSASEFAALTRTLVELRALSQNATVCTTVTQHASPTELDASRHDSHGAMVTRAAHCNRLYMNLSRAAMQLVGKHYVLERNASKRSKPIKYIERLIGLDGAEPMTMIELANILPLIHKAARLTDRIPSFAPAPDFARADTFVGPRR